MGNVLSRIMPSRSQSKDVKVVIDLDQIMIETIGFKFNGKVYEIKPVDTRTFLKMADVLGEIQSLIQSQASGVKISEDQIYDLYHRYISTICPDFTMKDLKIMPLVKVHGLLNLIIKHVTGQPLNLDDSEKKKTLKS